MSRASRSHHVSLARRSHRSESGFHISFGDVIRSAFGIRESHRFSRESSTLSTCAYRVPQHRSHFDVWNESKKSVA